MSHLSACLRIALSLAWLIPAISSTAADLPLTDNTKIHFATIDEGKKILSSRDRFLQAMSPFDRASRVETDQPVSEEEYIRFVGSNVLAWPADKIAKVESAVESLRKKLAPFKLPFPETIHLVHTTGREEGRAAYCRGAAIVLPTSRLDLPEKNFERLLNHELFHILSSHNPDLRESLYKIVGFDVCSPISFPEALRDRKLTNPDAPELDAIITIKVGDVEQTVTPILFSKSERFDPKQGGPFFRYLEFRLMAVQRENDHWVPVIIDGQPQLLQAAENADFSRKIGKNTDYIFHPDEILADNFVHLVQQTADLPSPQIIDEMRKKLSR